MSDLTPPLNSLLKKHNARLRPLPYSRSSIHDEFLKEAYRINDHIVSLHTYLLSIRRAYLSDAPPPRHHHRPSPTVPNGIVQPPEPTYLDNTARDAIDASTKTILRDLTASLRQLTDAETVRRGTAAKVLAKKYASGNLLTRWAAGGGVQGGKNTEQIEEEERLETVGMWRDGVVWFLGRGVEGLGESWRGMVERRVGRERERGRSVLYAMKNGQQDGESVGGGEGGWREGPGAGWGGERMGAKDVAMEEEARREMEMLSPEQLQLFAKENQDMLKRYEDTLDQVRTAERSMLEISELQSALVQNLDIQSANISQLVADSQSTTENVGGGNKELKRATERKSTARMVFWATCGLCGFLITWDLIF
ncbi:hypothetical protein MMC21_005046 [Puttea exsequens]|nr:hypothetical protein [Puttea exsequens]